MVGNLRRLCKLGAATAGAVGGGFLLYSYLEPQVRNRYLCYYQAFLKPYSKLKKILNLATLFNGSTRCQAINPSVHVFLQKVRSESYTVGPGAYTSFFSA